jgi:hypothetical protein
MHPVTARPANWVILWDQVMILSNLIRLAEHLDSAVLEQEPHVEKNLTLMKKLQVVENVNEPTG